MNSLNRAELIRAKLFAEKWHGDQKYGEFPYLSHLTDVLIICLSYNNLIIHQLCMLHDVIEDTECTRDDISKEFGTFMGKLVYLVSDEPGANRKLKKEATNKKLAAIDDEDEIDVIALIVKAADRLANMNRCAQNNNRGLLKMYVKEYPEFKKAVYRECICDEIWDQLFNLYDTYK